LDTSVFYRGLSIPAGFDTREDGDASPLAQGAMFYFFGVGNKYRLKHR
jgi:hypothetical protein